MRDVSLYFAKKKEEKQIINDDSAEKNISASGWGSRLYSRVLQHFKATTVQPANFPSRRITHQAGRRCGENHSHPLSYIYIYVCEIFEGQGWHYCLFVRYRVCWCRFLFVFHFSVSPFVSLSVVVVVLFSFSYIAALRCGWNRIESTRWLSEWPTLSKLVSI